MRSETNQHSIAATNTKTIDLMRRLRSSSRCSRNDIWPPSSSSPDSFSSSEFLSWKRGITVEWNRLEEFFSLPLERAGERACLDRAMHPPPNPSKGREETVQASTNVERTLLQFVLMDHSQSCLLGDWSAGAVSG